MFMCFKNLKKMVELTALSLSSGRATDPKFQAEGVAPTNHSSQKTRLSDLSCGIKIWTHHSFVLSQIMRLTDGQTEFSSLDRICIPRSMVKTCLIICCNVLSYICKTDSVNLGHFHHHMILCMSNHFTSAKVGGALATAPLALWLSCHWLKKANEFWRR